METPGCSVVPLCAFILGQYLHPQAIVRTRAYATLACPLPISLLETGDVGSNSLDHARLLVACVQGQLGQPHGVNSSSSRCGLVLWHSDELRPVPGQVFAGLGSRSQVWMSGLV